MKPLASAIYGGDGGAAEQGQAILGEAQRAIGADDGIGGQIGSLRAMP